MIPLSIFSVNLLSENLLLLGSSLIFISILVSKVWTRFGVPSLLLFLLLGMAAAVAFNLAVYYGGRFLSESLPHRCLETELDRPGTRVLMKAGKNVPETAELLRRKGLADRTALAADCGLPGERVFYGLDGLPEDLGYFATFIVKE